MLINQFIPDSTMPSSTEVRFKYYTRFVIFSLNKEYFPLSREMLQLRYLNTFLLRCQQYCNYSTGSELSNFLLLLFRPILLPPCK